MLNVLKDFLKNRVVIACLICSLIYLTTGYVGYLDIILAGVLIFFFFYFSIQESFCLFLFMHSFAMSDLLFCSLAIHVVSFSIIMLVKYIIGVKKGKYLIYKYPLIATIVLTILPLITSMFSNFSGIGLSYVFYLGLFYVLFALRKEINIKQGVFYLTIGLVWSCLLSLLYLVLPNYNFNCILGGRYYAFHTNPNYVYMKAMLILACYIYFVITKQIKLYQFFIIYVLMAIIIIATISKTGIAMLLLFSLIFAVLYTIKEPKKGLISIGILLAVGLLVGIICWDFIKSVLDRFLLTDRNDVLNSLFTGRIDIWKDYWSAITSHPLKFLFGHGYLAEEVFITAQNETRASHNFYIFLLHRFGFIGIIGLGVLIYTYLREIKPLKTKLINWLPLCFWLLQGLFDNTFKIHNIIYLPIVCFMLFQTNSTEQTTQPQEQPKKELTN